MIDLSSIKTLNEQDFKRVSEDIFTALQNGQDSGLGALLEKKDKETVTPGERMLIAAVVMLESAKKRIRAGEVSQEDETILVVQWAKRIEYSKIKFAGAAIRLFIAELSQALRLELSSDTKTLLGFLISDIEHSAAISEYFAIAQSPQTNELAKRITEQMVKPSQGIMFGVHAGNAEIVTKSLRVFIQGYIDLVEKGGITQSAARLLDCLLICATNQGLNSTYVTLPLKEYMAMRGLSDRKAAREQANRDLEALFRVSFEFPAKQRGKVTWTRARICEAIGEVKSGDIVFSFAPTFFNSLRVNDTGKYLHMFLPREALQGNINKNPYMYWLGRKIAEHKRMNLGKTNENIIAVKTLLGACPDFPTYKEVMATGRQVNRRIIEPFERDMDAFNESFSWNYIDGNGHTPSDYASFSAAMVAISWKNYPDTGELAARKTQRTQRENKARTAAFKKNKKNEQKGQKKNAS